MKIRELTSNHKCRFTVAIEGPDRVGKQTQTKLLAKRLVNEQIFDDVAIIEAPIKDQYTHKRIYEMLNDGRAIQYPSTFQGLQILNRVLYQETSLKTILHRVDAIVFDRWNVSSFAYGRAAGIAADELICELDMVAETDLTILLEGKPYPKDNLDDYESNMLFQKRVRDGYIEWAQQYSKDKITVINANDTIDAVHETIWQTVSIWLQEHLVPNNVIDIMPYIQAKRFSDYLEKEFNNEEPPDNVS